MSPRVCQRFEPVPQKLTSVRYKTGKPLDHKLVVQVIAESRDRLGKEGRLVIRESGTEPVIRVMAESDDAGARRCRGRPDRDHDQAGRLSRSVNGRLLGTGFRSVFSRRSAAVRVKP